MKFKAICYFRKKIFVKGDMSDSVTNYNYVGNTKVSVYHPYMNELIYLIKNKHHSIVYSVHY